MYPCTLLFLSPLVLSPLLFPSSSIPPTQTPPATDDVQTPAMDDAQTVEPLKVIMLLLLLYM